MLSLSEQQLITILKALADPNRLAIFDRLMDGDSCNCELNEQLGIAPNLMSHHLRVLQKAGLIHSRKDKVDGRWVYYAVDKETITICRQQLNYLLDPARIKERPILCGPEGQTADINVMI